MEKYSKRIVWIHWLSTLLILALIVTGVIMEAEQNDHIRFQLYQWHFLIGLGVFLLTLLRVYAFFKDPRPEKLYPKNKNRQNLIDFVHKGFYWIILWMCISGIVSLSVEGIIPALQAKDATQLPDLSQNLSIIMLSHHIVAKFVMLFLIMHVVGIILHIVKTKQNVFKRII